jgi:Zn-dependent M28 family amino/carboxypeptidase
LIDPEIEAIVSEVSESTYTAYIQRLQDFVTRYSHADSCRAAEEWAVDTFTAMGLETELFPFSYSLETWYNPIGRKIGTVYPDSIYMIIGHIDATSDNPYVAAPGAEDNASGSACVLEAARVLSQHEFACTIEFVLVSGEEQGLIGSEAYADYCLDNNRNIAGVLNFDMISYAGPYGWDTNIFYDRHFPAEVDLAALLIDLTGEYSIADPVAVSNDGPSYGSDHYYFSLYGFPAPFSIDAQLWGAPDWYPWYHSVDDQIDHLDLDFGRPFASSSSTRKTSPTGLSPMAVRRST